MFWIAIFFTINVFFSFMLIDDLRCFGILNNYARAFLIVLSALNIYFYYFIWGAL